MTKPKRILKGRRVPRAEWPEWLQSDFLKGVYVGGCVSRGKGSSFRATAHAHAHTPTHRGWICFRSDKGLLDRETGLHELAHIITGEGHTKNFRETLEELGGTIDYTCYGAQERGRLLAEMRKENTDA